MADKKLTDVLSGDEKSLDEVFDILEGTTVEIVRMSDPNITSNTPYRVVAHARDYVILETLESEISYNSQPVGKQILHPYGASVGYCLGEKSEGGN